MLVFFFKKKYFSFLCSTSRNVKGLFRSAVWAIIACIGFAGGLNTETADDWTQYGEIQVVGGHSLALLPKTLSATLGSALDEFAGQLVHIDAEVSRRTRNSRTRE